MEKGFWHWYIGGILDAIRTVFMFKWVKEPMFEILGGSITFGTIAGLLALEVHLAYISIGLIAITLFAHGYYRDIKASEKEEKTKE